MVDRLALTPKVIDSMIEGLRQVATLPDPIGEIRACATCRPVSRSARCRVPLGVIGIIYGVAPQRLTIDAASLCRQVRQCHHPAWRFRGHSFQSGDCPLHPAPGRWPRGRPAGQRRAGGGNHRPPPLSVR